MGMYPVFADIRGRRVVVVGGGRVAARKVISLIEAEADVTVISPEICEEIHRLNVAGSCVLLRRAYGEGDLNGCVLAFAATDDPHVNQRVVEEAVSSNILVNRADAPAADEPREGTFTVPSVIRRGSLSIAVSTGGIPILTKKMSAYLGRKCYPEIEEEIEELRRERKRIYDKTTQMPQEDRGREVETYLSSKIDSILTKMDRR